MGRIQISKADHDLISQAVQTVERHSDAEIVTVIAPHSDAYHDVGLHYAVAAMLSLLALVAAFPGFFSGLLLDLLGGWEHHLPVWSQLAILLAAQISVFLIVRYALAWMPLRIALTSGATKTRRVRRQAIRLFRACAEGRTHRRTAILIYLSLMEHRAEIVVDEHIASQVTPESWGDAMAALLQEVKAGRQAAGMVQAINMIGVIVAQHVPPTQDANPNELSDRLIEL